MKRVLVFYYSQSGQVRRAMESLTHPLQAAREIQVQVREIRPQVPYPFPWRRITAFFGVMPETVLGPPGFNLPLENGDQAEQPSADLVILAYPVWFLMPAPPVQRFLIDDAPRTMHGSRVVALCVCRGMWYHAARAVQQALQQLRCTNWSQVVVTHQGPQWATFLSVPRQMLFGSEGRLLPGLPPVGLSASELARLARIGEWLRSSLSDPQFSSTPGMPDATLAASRHSSILPELCAWPYFYCSAVAMRFLDHYCRPLRKPAIVLFAVVLSLLIVVALPLLAIASKLGAALFPGWLKSMANRITGQYASARAEHRRKGL